MNKQHYLYIEGQRVLVSEELYREYQKFYRKERYFSADLKMETFVCDPEKQLVAFLPSREDSYERLIDQNQQFASGEESVEDMVVRSILLEKLEKALKMLSTDELSLIYEIFYMERTEREISACMNVPSTTLHSRKSAILRKLRRLIENF